MNTAVNKSEIVTQTICTDLTPTIENQLKLEEEYSERSIIRGMRLVDEAMQADRFVEQGSYAAVFRTAFPKALQIVESVIKEKKRGIAGKYLGLIKDLNPEVLACIALRTMMNSAVNPEGTTLQRLGIKIGKMFEAEAALNFLNKVNAKYTQKVIKRLQDTAVQDIDERYKYISKTARNFTAETQAEWKSWKVEERVGAAKAIFSRLYEELGLWQWVQFSDGMYYLKPSPELLQHIDKMLLDVKPALSYPPMLIKPRKWLGQRCGGYYTEWWQENAKMCTLRNLPLLQRRWVLKQLESKQAEPLRAAMNALQEVPYRINEEVYKLLQQALATKSAILGLPRTEPETKPDFPFSGQDWDKGAATPQELAKFDAWKRLMNDWYTREQIRSSRILTLLQAIKSMSRFRHSSEIYFPTFIDWRGRIYYRGIWNPQSVDAIRGCLEFAEAKPLGERGLYWLKVHIANCCGYDKAHPDLRASYVDDNHDYLMHFLNDPINVESPEPSTSWQLLQALIAYRDALLLPNPSKYLCRVPIAMDATCSGLQHFSAMLKDPEGAEHVNLRNINGSEKKDIYKHVALLAKQILPELCDEVSDLYWRDKEIPRSMAKRPVMTYVYGSTLQSTMDYVYEDMIEQGYPDITDEDEYGNKVVLVTRTKLSVPVAKALRKAVSSSVPKADEAMRYLQKCTRATNRPLVWVTPVGMPVVNWAESVIMRKIDIKSMGVSQVTLRCWGGELSASKAVNSIAPNFVHSMDATHLCMVCNDFEGSLMAVHDSFASHAASIDAMHSSIRKTFVELYSQDILGLIAKHNKEVVDVVKPQQGNLNLSECIDSLYMFC